jgi:hypothetical protein
MNITLIVTELKSVAMNRTTLAIKSNEPSTSWTILSE